MHADWPCVMCSYMSEYTIPRVWGGRERDFLAQRRTGVQGVDTCVSVCTRYSNTRLGEDKEDYGLGSVRTAIAAVPTPQGRQDVMSNMPGTPWTEPAAHGMHAVSLLSVGKAGLNVPVLHLYPIHSHNHRMCEATSAV